MQQGTGGPNTHITLTRGPPLEGFAAAAQFVASDSDNEAFVFRKFDKLAARNLLYLQSELLAIEDELAQLDHEDAEAAVHDMGAKDMARTWETLTQRAKAGDPSAKHRMRLIISLRGMIRKYHEALLLQSRIAQLHQPGSRVLDTVRYWFRNPSNSLGGEARHFLDDKEDLVALNKATEPNYLSQLLRRHWPAQGETDMRGADRDRGIGQFAERSISLAVSALSIIVTAILLIGSIVSLYYVQDSGVKLGLIAVFTGLFASTIFFMTSARPVEIFTASAAYAAVLVVFISGNISN